MGIDISSSTVSIVDSEGVVEKTMGTGAISMARVGTQKI